MTEEIPEAGEPAEVEINFDPDDFGIRITAVLDEASIVVEHSWDGAEQAAILTQALPQILARVQTALDQQEES